MEDLAKLPEMTHNRLICRGAVFCGVVIGAAGPSGVVSGFDRENSIRIDRDARGRVKLLDKSFDAG